MAGLERVVVVDAGTWSACSVSWRRGVRGRRSDHDRESDEDRLDVRSDRRRPSSASLPLVPRPVLVPLREGGEVVVVVVVEEEWFGRLVEMLLLLLATRSLEVAPFPLGRRRRSVMVVAVAVAAVAVVMAD